MVLASWDSLSCPASAVPWHRAVVPQRRSISPLIATRLAGSSCFARGETLIHGSPCFLTIATQPASARAPPSAENRLTRHRGPDGALASGR